ncbi:MAG: hypothetical protein ACOYNY_36080 [Caldilineaceae bacterium]
MGFEVLSEISDVETFARGPGVRIRHYLNATYAGGRLMRWRHCKGVALIKWLTPLKYGKVELAEIHWFEAHGIGRVYFTYKKGLER